VNAGSGRHRRSLGRGGVVGERRSPDRDEPPGDLAAADPGEHVGLLEIQSRVDECPRHRVEEVFQLIGRPWNSLGQPEVREGVGGDEGGDLIDLGAAPQVAT
jgi:hypothetical protein